MTTTIPFKILLIGDDGYHLLMKMHINRKVAYVIIDTGASTTVFDKKKIQKFVTEKKFEKHDNLSTGLGSNKIKSEFTTLKNVKIGDLKITNYNTIIMDLTHVNQSYDQLGIKHVDGIVGNDILLKYKAIIDYNKATIKFKYVSPKQ